MFTGLIETTGHVRQMQLQGGQTRFTIAPVTPLVNVVLGESIAVNGVCLTVETSTPEIFSAYASAESMKVTTLGRLSTGSMVNLERALALGDRLGGHLVSGHVDCVAVIEAVIPAGESTRFRIGFPQEYAKEVVSKGSVALDGISLTINTCGRGFFEVNCIPETQKRTTAVHWTAGAAINMETDLIGKYVQRMIAPHIQQDGQKGQGTENKLLTEEFLHKHGF